MADTNESKGAAFNGINQRKGMQGGSTFGMRSCTAKFSNIGKKN